MVYVLEPVEVVPGDGFRAKVRRIEASPEFLRRFGAPLDTVIDNNHALADVIPIGRKMRGPLSLQYMDRNGMHHECIADSFDTTHNVLVLVYPKLALTSTTIILPAAPAS